MKERKLKEKKKERKKLIVNFIKLILIKKHCDDYVKFSQINNHISESNKKLTEESSKDSLIDEISKRLFVLKF